MKRVKKLWAFVLTVAMLAVYIPSVATAATDTSTLAGAISEKLVKMVYGSVGNPTDATVNYQGGTKTFSGTAYKFSNGNTQFTAAGTLEGYDRVEMYAGMSADSPEGSSANVIIYKYKAVWNEDGTLNDGKKYFSSDTLTFNAGDSAKKLILDMIGFDSFTVTVQPQNGGTAVLGDLKLVKEDNAEWDTWYEATNGTGTNFEPEQIANVDWRPGPTYYGGVKQYMMNAWTNDIGSIWTEGEWDHQPTLRGITAGKYYAIEFNLGYDLKRTTHTGDDYYDVAIMPQSSSGLGYMKFKAYNDKTTQKVVVPLSPNTTQIRFDFKRRNADGTGNNGDVEDDGKLVPQISGMKLYKNARAATSFKDEWGVNMTTNFPPFYNAYAQWNEMGMAQNIQDYSVKKDGKYVTMRGNLIAKQKAVATNVQDGRNGHHYTTCATYITGHMIDRYRGYAAIPDITNNTTVKATADDRIRIYGCNYALERHNIGLNGGLERTVLYEVTGMQDGFGEYFDVDVSDYDCIQVEAYMPYAVDADNNVTACRFAGIFNASTIGYTSDVVEAGYFNNTDIANDSITKEKVVYVQSQKARTAGTVAAEVYSIDNNGQSKLEAFKVNNNALLGSGTKTITVFPVTSKPSVTVINPAEIDLTDVAVDKGYVKVYYSEATAAADAANLAAAGMTSENLIGTFRLSDVYTDIDSVVAVDEYEIGKGVLFEEIGLPKTVSVTAGGETYTGIGVTWAKGNYDDEIAGTYTTVGTLNAEDLAFRNLKNSSNLKATATIIVTKADIQTEKNLEKDVRFGGGGFVTGITFHPLDADLIYARTDVGGAFKSEDGGESWVSITDWMPNHNMYGIDAIAVDPNDADTVYMVAGMYWYKQGHAIYKSTDRGETWTDISFNGNPQVFGGGCVNRGMGESFVVDPANSDVLYCGTRTDGLWKSEDGGENWTKTSLEFANESNLTGGNCTGIRSIAIDGNTVYAGVYANTNTAGGVYKSTDGGDSWVLLDGEGYPTLPLEIKVYEGDVYVASGEHWNANVAASFKMYDTSEQAWVDMTPEGYASEGIGSFDIYNNGGNRVIYLAGCVPGSNLHKKVGNSDWTTDDVSYDVGELWLTTLVRAFDLYGYSGDIEIHVVDGKADLWVTDGGVGVWKITDVEASSVMEPKVEGIEVTYTLDIAIPVADGFEYELVSSNADYRLIKTTDVDVSAEAETYQKFSTGDWFGRTHDVDIASGNGQYAAFTYIRYSDGAPDVALSEDGGVSFAASEALDANYWTTANSADLLGGNVAIGSGTDKPNVVFSGVGYRTDNNDYIPVMYSNDFGASWDYSQYNGDDLMGVGSRYDILDSDKVDPDAFYIYDPINAKVYTSKDGGANFTMSSPAVLAGADMAHDTLYHPTLKAKPGTAGEVWISNSKGIFKSSDYGTTWSKVSNDAMVNKVKGFSFGKGVSDDVPAVYVLGNVEGEFGLFRSEDNGASWIKLNDEISGAISATAVEADMNKYGRVYIGTGGRGIYYFDVAKKLVGVTENEANEYEVSIINNENAQNMTAVSALYVDGALKDVIIGESKSVGSTDTLKVAKPVYEGESQQVERKVFIWDGISSMRPIFGAVSK